MEIDKEKFQQEYDALEKRIDEIIHSCPEDRDLALALMLERVTLKLSAFEMKCTDLLLSPDYIELKILLIIAGERFKEISAENAPYTGEDDLIN